MFRFTLRDVLWLMVVVGLVLGWALERHRSTRLQHAVAAAENDANLSRAAIETLYDDLSRIEQSLAPHGLTFSWSRDLRPSVQTMPPLAGKPTSASSP
jgi:hypothetical protein